MLADGLNSPQSNAALGADAADARLVSAMRLVLAVSVWLASIINPGDFQRGGGGLVGLLFAAYVLHSLLLHLLAILRRPFVLRRRAHWLDVAWCALFVALTGGSRSLLFLFFFFAILTASFRWGFEEGARVTVAATALFAATALLPGDQTDRSRLLLRSSFLLALGYISAYWGESKVDLTRRLALLRDVSQLSNPRFGVDQTLTRVLEATRRFFGAPSCVLVLRDRDSGACQLRTVQAGRAPQPVSAEPISAQAAQAMLALAPGQLITAGRARWPLRGLCVLACTADGTRWLPVPDPASGERLTDLFGSPGFISAPVALRRAEGRLFVLLGPRAARKVDALFLAHIGAQAFPVVENIELVDRMASQAASQERQKIALDIHDRAVQPYIGLTLGLSALRNKAAPTNPLLEDIDKLTHAARQAIEDLRHYAGSFKRTASPSEPVLAAALQQQAAQVKALYGVDIAVAAAPDLQVNDRMTAELLQIVREGLSNICRHTLAQRGALRLQRSAGWLHMQIDNDGNQPVADFSPRSITERVQALGGQVRVLPGACGGSSVQVHIPV